MRRVSAPANEGTYLREGEQLEVASNPTTEKLRTLASGMLMAGFFALGVSLAGFRNGWSVLGTTLATSAGAYAWSRLNLEGQTRKMLCFLVAGATYELFLTLYTIAGANSKNEVLHYLPLFSLMLGGAIWLELSTQAISKTWRQLNAPKAPEAGRDMRARFWLYPSTRQTVWYCGLQGLPAAAGTILVVLGKQNGGVPGFLMQSSGVRMLTASVGRVAQNLFTNLALLPSLLQDHQDDVPFSQKSKRLIALNEGVQQAATLLAPVTYAVALTANQIPVMTATGFLNGMLDAEGQRKLEEDGLRPSRFSEDQKWLINRVALAVSGIFGALFIYYLIRTPIKTEHEEGVNHPATWGAACGIIGTAALNFGFTKGIQYAWNSAAERGAFVWLSRLFGAENTRWLAYLNADFLHVRNMRGSVPSLKVIMAGLLLTGATIGLDLALLNDDRLVTMKLSAFAWALLMRYAATVPGSFPMPPSNSTMTA